MCPFSLGSGHNQACFIYWAAFKPHLLLEIMQLFVFPISHSPAPLPGKLSSHYSLIIHLSASHHLLCPDYQLLLATVANSHLLPPSPQPWCWRFLLSIWIRFSVGILVCSPSSPATHLFIHTPMRTAPAKFGGASHLFRPLQLEPVL